MKNEYHNLFDERIKQLKETIEYLSKENMKLRKENQKIQLLKEIIIKLKNEKREMSQKIIDYESESLLYNSLKRKNEDILLYNPNPSKKKLNFEKSNFFFNIKNIHYNTKNIQNNETIEILKKELNKKEEIITLLKSSKKLFKPVIVNDFSINSSSYSSHINSNSNSAMKNITFKNDKKYCSNKNSVLSHNMKSKYSNKIISTFSWKDEYKIKTKAQKSKRDSPYEDCDSLGSLEKNIYKEIQNILKEKRNFLLKTLVRENFSFDIINSNINKNNKDINQFFYNEIKGMEDIDKLIEIIKHRKIKVKNIKKYFEDKLI